jgi:hypothetical protein
MRKGKVHLSQRWRIEKHWKLENTEMASETPAMGRLGSMGPKTHRHNIMS